MLDYWLLQPRSGAPRNLAWTGRRCGFQLTRQQQAFFVRRNEARLAVVRPLIWIKDRPRQARLPLPYEGGEFTKL